MIVSEWPGIGEAKVYVKRKEIYFNVSIRVFLVLRYFMCSNIS